MPTFPFRGAGIGVFDGNGDYLGITQYTDFNFLHNGTTPYTIAFWCYPTRFAAENILIDTSGGSLSNNGIWFALTADGYISFGVFRGVNDTYVIGGTYSSSALTLNSWNYIKVRVDLSLASGNVEIYINEVAAGVLNKTANSISSGNCKHCFIGMYETSAPTSAFQGHLSELKISIVWEPILSPPRRQLMPDSNTKLLLHFLGSGQNFVDSSPSPKTITPYNDVKQLRSYGSSGISAGSPMMIGV